MFSKNKNGCFDCDKCPRNSDAQRGRYCVMWWETQWTNAAGDTQTEKSCGFTQWPRFAVEIIKASNRPAAAVESMRNEMSRGLFAIAEASQALPHLMPGQIATPQITDSRDGDAN